MEYGLHLVRQKASSGGGGGGGGISSPKELFGRELHRRYHRLRILSSKALTADSYKTKLVCRSPKITQITSSARFIRE
ncbi:hypothetical protein V9T40_008303 [Parthenolecanium corni]|uniref:Uncharacterized protein n=1 Tax=Parthenolecanium corni TaxID=536013 RepID=A0AAN9TLF5_9HEMI